nr:uncharacterized mitochondrial protein AtMg00810-like [Tanacetum cinerariifolium]
MTSHLNAVKKIFKYLKGQPNLGSWHPRDSPFQLEAYSDSDYAGSHGDRKSTTGGWDANEKNLIQVLKIHKDENVADLLTKAFDGPRFHFLVYVYILTHSCRFYLVYCRMTAVSCEFLLYAVQTVYRPPMLLVVPVFLLVVLVLADGWVSAGSCTIPTGSCTIPTGSCTISTGSCTIPTGSCTIPTGSYSFMLLDWFLMDDHNKVAYLEKGKGWEAYEQILEFLNRSHIRFALTHRLPIVFDSLVKQFWATATVRTLEAGPSEIIATIDGNEAVVTESLIRTQLHLNDANGLYEITLHDVLDGMREIGFLQMILGIQTTDPSPRPTFNFTTKLFSNMKLNWDGPHMPLLAPMLVFPAGGDGADAAIAGAAAANEVLPPPPPPHVPPTHTSSSSPGPSTATQDTPMRAPTPVREPTHSPVREPTTFREPIPDTPRPPSPPPYPRSEEVDPTTSTRPPSPTRQTSFQEDISKGGGDYVSSPKFDEALPTIVATAAGGAEDSAGLTDLSLKLDRCINRVITLENELGVTKKVLGGAVLKLVSRVKWKTVTSSPFKHFQENIIAVAYTIPAGGGIPADAQTIPAGSTPIPSFGADDKGKAPMVDDSLLVDLLTEQERILKNLHDYQLGEDLAKKLHAEQEAEFARQQEELAQKAQAESADWLKLMDKIATNTALSKQLLGDDVNKDNMNERLGMLLMRKRQKLAEQSRVKPINNTQQRDFMRDFVKNHSASVYNQGWTMKQVPASVPTTPSTAVVVSVLAAPSIPADVSVSVAPSVHADTEVDVDESRLDATQTSSEHVSTEHTAAESTSLSLRTRHKQIAKKRVTPIVEVADDALINFDSDSDDDPLPYAPYAVWEMVPSPLGSIHAYYDIEGHTKHFTSLCKLLHMVEKNDLRKLLGVVHVLEIVDGRVIYMFVNVSYPLSVATLTRMLKHGLEVLKLLVGGDLTMAEQLVSIIKAALLNAQSAIFVLVFTTQQMVFSSPWLTAKKELTHHEGTALMLLFYDPAVFGVPAGFFISAGFLVAAVWLFAAVLFCSYCWNIDAILELTSEDLSRILKLTLLNSRLGNDCWELQN